MTARASEPAGRAVATREAPAAIGPYVQARIVAGLVFCSGQIGLEPESGELVAGGVAAEARQALANLDAVLRAARSGLDRVVKTTVYLVDMAEFPAMNQAYAEAFATDPPARSTVAVAALPRGARFEIEATATAG